MELEAMRIMGAERADRGFTLVELLLYLALFALVSGTIVGSQIFAERVNRTEGALVQALGQIDTLFAAIAADCDRATDVRPSLAGSGEVRLEGAATYEIVPTRAEILRDGRPLVSHAVSVRFERDADHPELLRVRVQIARGAGAPEARPSAEKFERTFLRTFFVRNAMGGGGAAY